MAGDLKRRPDDGSGKGEHGDEEVGVCRYGTYGMVYSRERSSIVGNTILVKLELWESVII